ncbi:hypothetical protein [Rossellomorea aquimaris]|nr:hypothetical protein [Rossellomorea aquimaris]
MSVTWTILESCQAPYWICLLLSVIGVRLIVCCFLGAGHGLYE